MHRFIVLLLLAFIYHLPCIGEEPDSFAVTSCHTGERLYWDNSAETPRLISRAFTDPKGQILLCHTYTYDNLGRVIKETLYGDLTGKNGIPLELQPNGQPVENGCEHYATTYLYSDTIPDLLLSQAEDNGKVIRYIYQPGTNHLTAKFICENEAIRLRSFYFYDKDGLLIKTIQDDGSSLKFDDLQGVTERHMTASVFRQDKPGMGLPEISEEKYLDLATCEEQLLKRTHHGVVDSDSQPILGVDASIRKVHSTFKQEISDAEGVYRNSLYSTYDAKGNLLSHTDAEGNVIENSYDHNGNKIVIAQRTKDSWRQTHNCYDPSNRLIRSEQTDHEGNLLTTTHRYDAAGNRIASCDPSGNATLFEYDVLGRLIKKTFPEVLDENGAVVNPVETYEYDISDRIIAATDANGDTIRTKHNARGSPVEICYPDGTKEFFEYRLDGILCKSTAKNGTNTIYHHDYQGRTILTEYLDSAGVLSHTTAASYNAFHMIASTDARGYVTTYRYDGAGRQVEVTMELEAGTAHVEFSYDALGQQSRQKNWFGTGPEDFTVFITERDGHGDILETRIEDSSGNILKTELKPANKIKETEYKTVCNYHFVNDRGQNVLQKNITDTFGNMTITTQDALGRVESVVKKNSLGQTLSQQEMRYDRVGNKVRETHTVFNTDASSHAFVATWKYGPGKRVEEVTEGAGSPQQRRTAYQYNALGQLEHIIKPDGVQLSYFYDASGRLSMLTSSDNTIGYQYEYDASNNVIQIEDMVQGTVMQRTYNAFNQMTSETLGNGLSLANTFDRQGRRTQQVLPDGSGIEYCYDAGHLKEIHRLSSSQQRQYTHRYTSYDMQGKLVSAELIGQLGKLSCTYDAEQRFTGLHTSYWSEMIPGDGYDRRKNVTKISVKDCAEGLNTQYGYDDTQRLTSEIGLETNSYRYDSLGNRLNKNQDNYAVDELNQLKTSSQEHYIYDANGCLIEKTADNETVTYKYDAMNRLIQATQTEKFCLNYTYDAVGRCLEKNTALWDESRQDWDSEQQTLRFIYDGENEIGSVEANGKISALRILGLGKGAEIGAAVAIELGQSIYAPIHDHRGSVRCLVDMHTQQAVEYYRYTSFGEAQFFDGMGHSLQTSELGNPWRFSSKRFEEEIGLIYFGKRFYAPSIGRWITPDPLGFVDGPNRYSFVHNNPIALQDMYGLFSFRDSWDSLMTSLCQAFDTMASATQQVFNYIKDNLSYSNKFKPHVDDVAHQVFGRAFLSMLGYFEDIPETGTYGKGELSDKVRITAINGILNLRSDMLATIHDLSEAHGGINIHYVFYPTQGWGLDLLKAAAIKFGHVSLQARHLADTWKKLIQEMGGTDGGGLIIHYAHSIGGTNTYYAKSLLTPEEQRMIRVITVGSASMLDDEGFESVRNYVSCRDGVSLFDPVGYVNGYFTETSNVLFMGTFYGFPFIDHMLSASTYKRLIEVLGQQFLDWHEKKR